MNDLPMSTFSAIDAFNVVMFIGVILVFIAGKLADKGTREIEKRTEEKRKQFEKTHALK